jgi:hypothetical protein
MFFVDLISTLVTKFIDFLFSKKEKGDSKQQHIHTKENKGNIQQYITYNYYVNKYYPSAKETPPSPVEDTFTTSTLDPTDQEIEDAINQYIEIDNTKDN